ncbi:MAG: heavy-metal-associated domain-containing protein [Desulfitobacteriia bacterium]|jgi:copper chaperone
MKKKILIEGMNCGHCVKHVTEALKELNGVTGVDVNLDSKTAVVEASAGIDDEEIKFTIDDVGYKVVGIEELQ